MDQSGKMYVGSDDSNLNDGFQVGNDGAEGGPAVEIVLSEIHGDSAHVAILLLYQSTEACIYNFEGEFSHNG